MVQWVTLSLHPSLVKEKKQDLSPSLVHVEVIKGAFTLVRFGPIKENVGPIVAFFWCNCRRYLNPESNEGEEAWKQDPRKMFAKISCNLRTMDEKKNPEYIS